MNVTPAKFLFGIIGSPLGHTASPLLHSWAFAQMNIPAAYYTWPMQPDYLENFVQAMRLLPCWRRAWRAACPCVLRSVFAWPGFTLWA